MTLREIVESFDGRLTKADRQVLQVLLADPAGGPFLSAQELAERASVHPTSAVRLAQKLGFSGYPDLRSKLREELLGRPAAPERMQQRLAHLGHGSLKAFADTEIAALYALSEQVHQDDIEKTAKILMAARRIYLFAFGHAEILALLMDMRLSRSGYQTRVMRQSPRHLATDLVNIGGEDAVLAFRFSADDTLVPAILDHTNAVGANSVVVCDTVGLTLRPNPDILLSASRGTIDEAQSLTVPMAICNTIILAISQFDDGHSISQLAKIGVMREKLGTT